MAAVNTAQSRVHRQALADSHHVASEVTTVMDKFAFPIPQLEDVCFNTTKFNYTDNYKLCALIHQSPKAGSKHPQFICVPRNTLRPHRMVNAVIPAQMAIPMVAVPWMSEAHRAEMMSRMVPRILHQPPVTQATGRVYLSPHASPMPRPIGQTFARVLAMRNDHLGCVFRRTYDGKPHPETDRPHFARVLATRYDRLGYAFCCSHDGNPKRHKRQFQLPPAQSGLPMSQPSPLLCRNLGGFKTALA
ncbi:hypothetical protein DFJ58DRAFT_850200 [Suillus subalutaceus]|uniref:uncharacterized protein n=1 Tax=Suillus subalutaceus TaxID=48586 RepID=UPI001B85FADC|nr:uncharacterized protein DFJ58DRAFT_850200 [Suillus subalutaceus]KAG1819401.1 hypothetical protein DFJ58DRAFT_850200 [Suillus subalutaceus]